MEKLTEFIPSFRIEESTKKILRQWADEEYVRYLCDHIRLLLNKAVRQYVKDKNEDKQ